MGDPYRKRRPGERASGIPAAAWNGLLDDHRRLRASALGVPDVRTASHRITPSITALVKWEGADPLPPQSVLAFDGVVIDPDDRPFEVQRRPTLVGIEPATAEDAFCITTGPVMQAGLVESIVQGLAVVDVDVTDAAHTHATATAGDSTKLTSATSGRAEILWKPTGTGVKSCVVLVAGGSGCEGVACGNYYSVNGGAFTKSYSMVNGDELNVTEMTTPLVAGTTYHISAGIYGGVIPGGGTDGKYARLWAKLVLIDIASGSVVNDLTSSWLPLGDYLYVGTSPTYTCPVLSSLRVRQATTVVRYTPVADGYAAAWRILLETNNGTISTGLLGLGGGGTYILYTTACGDCDPEVPA